ASWLTRLTVTNDPATVWPAGTIVVIDEATQVSTRDMAALTAWATRLDAVLLAVGDPAQLASVGAGGGVPRTLQQSRAPRPRTRRHRRAGDDMADVRIGLSELRSTLPRDVASAMARLAGHGRVHLFDSQAALVERVVDDWYWDRTHRHDNPEVKVSRMMAARH